MIPRKVNDAATAIEVLFKGVNTELCSRCPTHAYEMEKNGKPTMNVGCCKWCAGDQGHFGLGHNNKIIRYLKKKFWWCKEYGFFNPTIPGCNLPRVLRSGVCLQYFCSNVAPWSRQSTSEEIKRFEIFRKLLAQYVSVILAERVRNPNWYKEWAQDVLHERSSGV